MPALAVLFLVIDALPHADAWRRWAEEAAPDAWSVCFFIHAKHRETMLADPRTPAWVRDAVLPVSFRPEWGSVELVRAELALVAAALSDRDHDIQWLLFASETCLPVMALPRAIAELTTDRRSWLAYDIPRLRHDMERFRAIRDAGVPAAAICKADQWACLTRRHAEILLRYDEDHWGAFQHATASDEWYISTCFAQSGLIDLQPLRDHERAFQEQERRRQLYGRSGASGAASLTAVASDAGSASVARRRLTYRYWPVPSSPSPEFLNFDATTLAAAAAEGCIFARKFAP